VMCRWVTSVPADGYPGGRATARPDRGQGDQGAKDAKALMQAIAESSLVLSRQLNFPARITLKERIPHPSRISPFRIQIKQVPRRKSKSHCNTLTHIGISELPTPVSYHPLNRKKCPSLSPPCAAVQPPSQSAPSQRVSLPSSRA
jgi:hypothetical protein